MGFFRDRGGLGDGGRLGRHAPGQARVPADHVWVDLLDHALEAAVYVEGDRAQIETSIVWCEPTTFVGPDTLINVYDRNLEPILTRPLGTEFMLEYGVRTHIHLPLRLRT